MSNTKTIDQSQSGRSRGYERLTPESAVLLLIDHQSGLVSGIRDLAPDLLAQGNLMDIAHVQVACGALTESRGIALDGADVFLSRVTVAF